MARLFKTGITAEGDISTSGKVSVTASAGDEGGEIFLNKSATNTTLTGGVTIDVWQNRLRFFEQGGDARGFYIDISTGGNSVGTNLVGGGGGTTTNALTIASPLTGTSFNGSSAVTIGLGTSLPSVTSVNGTTIPSAATLLTSTSTSSALTTVGTIGTGVWNGTVINPTYGGTGVNNGSKTITLSGNTTIGSSTHTVAFVTSGNTSVTLPTTGTLAISSGSQTFTGVQSMTSPAITTSITTPSTSFDLVNTTATTINFGGAASTLNIGKTGLGNTVTIGNALSVTGRLLVGGGNGSTGLTVEDTGELLTDGAISATGTVTGGNLTTGGTLTRTTLNGGGTTGASINNTGQFIRTSSSQRYKQDIQDAEFVYEDVLALAPKTFRLKDEAQEDPNSRVYGGLIAEEVDQLESLKVFVNYQTQEDGSKIPDGIAYGEMVAALISAIKHQDARIQALEAQVQALSE